MVWPWRQLCVAGCAQTCAQALPAVLRNLTGLLPWFEQGEVLILENDSSDATPELLRCWSREEGGRYAFSFPGLQQQQPVKTERLAHLRNAGLAWFRQRQLLHPQSLLLVLDLDAANAEPWDLTSFRAVLEWMADHPQLAAVSANQRGLYYDLWALRHPQFSPDDLWEHQFELHLQHPQLSDAELMELVLCQRRISLPENGPPIFVESAFGGLSFYAGGWLQRLPDLRYSGSRTRWIGSRLIRWACCEHVAFHAQLRSAGAQLVIHPRLLNGTTPELPFNPSSWRYLLC